MAGGTGEHATMLSELYQSGMLYAEVTRAAEKGDAVRPGQLS